MNTISVAAVLKRPFFRIRGEKNAVDPFPGLTHSANVHLYFN